MIAIAGPSANGQYTVFDYESWPYRLYGTYSRQVDAEWRKRQLQARIERDEDITGEQSACQVKDRRRRV